MADEALARFGFAALGREKCRNVQFSERGLNPTVNAFVALNGGEGIPFVRGGESEAVGPVGIVRDEAACGGTPDERTKRSQAFDVGIFLEIAKGSGGFGPTVKAKDGSGKTRHGFEQGLVEGHVVGRVICIRLKEEPQSG